MASWEKTVTVELWARVADNGVMHNVGTIEVTLTDEADHAKFLEFRDAVDEFLKEAAAEMFP